ncbi:MAG: TonB-dependent receptor [Acidobacteria bacterium]|nr:TonB-dependent receptor [Acidobacteriota bacterium]
MKLREALRTGFVFLFLCCGCASAQVTSGTISGTLTDDTGAVVPGALVTGTNVETGFTRTIETDARGAYHLRQLPVGSYDVKAEATGFQTSLQKGIKLTVGQEAVIDLGLHVGAVAETVTITSEAPMVETTTSSVSALVDDRQIRALPLNGRDYTQLVTLQMGAVEADRKGGGNIGRGTGKRISVNGSRPTSNAYLVDGTEIGDHMGQAPGGVSGQALGVEAIREFSVLTTSYSAAYPSQGGAVVNAITQSGTNDIHGALFEFLRNSAMDSNEWVNNRNRTLQPGFKRNQFGFALGGPVAKDKTFYFGSIELLKERLGKSTTIPVPDENARRGLIPIVDSQGNVSGYNNVGVHADIAPFMNLYQPINGQRFPSLGTGEFFNVFSQPTDENYWMSRVDHRFSESNSAFVRYTFDNSKVSSPNLTSTAVNTSKIRWQYATVEHSHVYSPTWINTFRLGWNRSHAQETSPITFSNLPSRFDFTPGHSFGEQSTLSVTGGVLGTLGGDPTRDYITNFYQVMEDVLTTQRSHQLRFGGRVGKFGNNWYLPTNTYGVYSFANLESFLTARPQSFQGMNPEGADTFRSYVQWMIAGYVDDKYQVRPNLVLNLGLRYEMAKVPTEKHNRLWAFRTASDLFPTQGPLYKSTSQMWNIQPRIGFAWNVRGDGKTAVRAGFGVYQQYLRSPYWGTLGLRQPPLFNLVTANNPPFLSVYRTVDPASLRPSLQSGNYDIDPPYLLQQNFTVQHQIMAATSLTVSYVGSRGNHLAAIRSVNIKAPTILTDGRKCYNFTGGNPSCPNGSLTLLNPNLQSDSRSYSDGQSFFNSLQMNLSQRLQRGLQMGLSYTFSKLIDEGPDRWDSTGAPGSADPGSQDPFDHKERRGPSPLDVRNNLVVNFLYELPKTGFQSSIPKHLLDGWQVNGILRSSSGKPFTPVLGYNRVETGLTNAGSSRPNLKAGANNNPVLGGPDKYFDASSFELQPRGFLGNAGVGTISGPGFANLDFGLVKLISFSERRSIEFRTEFFNLLNHPNYLTPRGVIQTSATAPFPSPTAARIDDTVNTARQIQLALKIAF